MLLTPLGPNRNEYKIISGPRAGVRVLFSYRTPVAAFVPGVGFLRSKIRYSMTTSRHVNQWIGATAKIVEQEEIDNLMR